MKLFEFFAKDKADSTKTTVEKGGNVDIKQNYENCPKYTPEHINSLLPNEVFVFGSNLAGQHGGGAARTALNKFGAIYGQGVGLQGQSYAIPTMQGGIETISPYMDEFIDFAKEHSEIFFYVTRIGCGIAGFRDEEIAPLFEKALNLDNVCLPESFVRLQIEQSESCTTQEFENKELIEIKLSVEILNTLSVYDIIYAEFAEGGAMGCAGQTMLYIVNEKQFVRYVTDLFSDENTYAQVAELLLTNSGLENFPLFGNVDKQTDNNKNQFNYYYGGFGNHVFVNKKVLLKENEEHFVYNQENKEYHIYSSVFGVFSAVANQLQTKSNEGNDKNTDR